MIPTFFFVCSGLLALLGEPVLAECPDPQDLDVKYNRTHYYGAYWYKSQSSPNTIQSCKGSTLKRCEGFEEIASATRQFTTHALVVRPGCLVYEFSDYDYQGNVTEYRAGVHPNIPQGTKSYKMRCNIPHFDCTPTDRYEAVQTCDATAAVVGTECNYIKITGTKFSPSVSKAMSLDEKLEDEMSSSFWGLFNTTLGTSASTGYDWKQVSVHTKETEQHLEVKATTPSGYIMKIEQVVGRCGRNKVYTERFRITTQQVKRTGTVTTKFFKASKNKADNVNPNLSLNKH